MTESKLLQLPLLERYREAYATLDEFQIYRVRLRVSKKWGKELPLPDTGNELFDLLAKIPLDHAQVILAMADDPDKMSRATVEHLTGRPIIGWSGSVSAILEQRRVEKEARRGKRPPGEGRSEPYPECRPKAVDTRMVVSVVQPNPRRPESEAYATYQHWKEGVTVQDCLDRGLTARALRRDVRHGFVKLGSPR